MREIPIHPNQPPAAAQPAPPPALPKDDMFGGSAMRRELEVIEAASKPLPLQSDEEASRLKGPSRSQAVEQQGRKSVELDSGDNPLGPL